MSTENRFAMLFEDDEEEVKTTKPNTKTTKGSHSNNKRVGNVRPGKREFDRHSGTGRGREIPKNGSGARNWGNPKDVKQQLADETQEIEKSPAEEPEVVEEPKPTVFTLEEYEAQRKAKMSSLIGKKEARVVEEIQGEKIEKIEGDYFAAEGYKNKQKKAKKEEEEEEEEEEVILNFQAVDGSRMRERAPRPQNRFNGRNDRRHNDNRRGGKNERAHKINLKSEQAFPKL